jgi:hypothetical protein
MNVTLTAQLISLLRLRKCVLSYTFIPLDNFMVWCLIKYGDSFTSYIVKPLSYLPSHQSTTVFGNCL